MPDDTINLPRPAAWLSPESGQVLRDGDITHPETWAIGLHTADTVRRLISEAVAAEREACARVCDGIADDLDAWRPVDDSRGEPLRKSANLIRARNGDTE
jgi:hypothetical protein